MSGPGGGPLPAERAARVKLVIFDVDGVLTDGGAYMGGTGDEVIELKRFDIRDGLGLKLLQAAGLEVIMISGRVSPATEARARELGVAFHQDAGAQKLPAVQAMMERLEIGWDEVAMLADDWPDMAVFRQVGLRAAVANAIPQIAEIAHWQTSTHGGRGAAREFCDALLHARGELDAVTARYVEERS